MSLQTTSFKVTFFFEAHHFGRQHLTTHLQGSNDEKRERDAFLPVVRHCGKYSFLRELAQHKAEHV